jgi:hypothetical protein
VSDRGPRAGGRRRPGQGGGRLVAHSGFEEAVEELDLADPTEGDDDSDDDERADWDVPGQ